jgi:hypothetical protein
MRSSLFALLLCAGAARAETIDARSITLLAGRADPRDGNVHTVVPLYELLSLRVADLRIPFVRDVRVVVSMWGAVDPGDPPEERTADGDVDVAYLEARVDRVRVRVGRQLLPDGVGRVLSFDGARAEALVAGPFGISAQGGLPVTPRFGVDRGDALGGARAFWRGSIDAEAGLSFLHVQDDGRVARQDLGVDARVGRWAAITATGLASWSLAEMRLAEAELAVAWQPWPALRLVADGTRLAPDLFLPRSSIISVFSDETRDEAGVSAAFRPGKLRLYGEGRVISVEAGEGGRAALRAEWREPWWLGGAEVRRYAVPDGGYAQARLFGRARLRRGLGASLDLDLYVLDEEVNGETSSLTATAAATWERGPWRASVAGVIASDPFFEQRFEVMARLQRDLSLKVRAP